MLSLSAGFGFTLALRVNGTVACWRSPNVQFREEGLDYGVCNIPTGLANVTTIMAGWLHGMAITANGTVVAWGSYVSIRTTPYTILGAAYAPAFTHSITALAGGCGHSLALTSGGKVVEWGLGFEHDETGMPLSIGLSGSGPSVTAISVMGINSIALRNDGSVMVWGDNGKGQLSIPLSVSMNDVRMVVAGWQHFVVVFADDAGVVGWGLDDAGESNPPAGLVGVVAIAAGYRYSAALTASGAFETWGLMYGSGDSTQTDITGVLGITGGFEQLTVMSDCHAITKLPPPPPTPSSHPAAPKFPPAVSPVPSSSPSPSIPTLHGSRAPRPSREYDTGRF